MAETCATCKYFDGPPNDVQTIGQPVVGMCRCDPPKIIGARPDGAQTMSGQPTTRSDALACREYKLAILARV